MSRAEDLFTIEQKLRDAAVNYASTQNLENRKRLRTAAIDYAEAASAAAALVVPAAREQLEQPGELEEVDRG